MGYTLHDHVRCITKELERRKLVYPRAVQEGKLTAVVSNREIAQMEAVLKCLLDLCDGIDPLPGPPKFDQYGCRTA